MKSNSHLLQSSNNKASPMELPEIIDIIENERQCVSRADKGECNRDCLNCDLLKDSNDIIQSYDYVLNVLRNMSWERNFWKDFITRFH